MINQHEHDNALLIPRVREKLTRVYSAVMAVSDSTRSSVSRIAKLLPVAGIVIAGAATEVGCGGDDFSMMEAQYDGGSDVEKDVIGQDGDAGVDAAEDVAQDVVEEDAAEDAAEDVAQDVVEEDAAEDAAEDVVQDVVAEDAADDVVQDVVEEDSPQDAPQEAPVDAGCTGTQLYITTMPGYDYIVVDSATNCSHVLATTVNNNTLETNPDVVCLNSGDRMLIYSYYSLGSLHNDLVFTVNQSVYFQVRRGNYVHNGAPNTAFMHDACQTYMQNGICSTGAIGDSDPIVMSCLYDANPECNASYDPQDVGTMFQVIAP